MKIKFDDPDDFLAELHARGPNVDRLVRLTRQQVESRRLLGMADLYITASYLHCTQGNPATVVECRQYAGPLRMRSVDALALTVAAKIEAKLREGIQAAGYEIAAGAYEDKEAVA